MPNFTEEQINGVLEATGIIKMIARASANDELWSDSAHSYYDSPQLAEWHLTNNKSERKVAAKMKFYGGIKNNTSCYPPEIINASDADPLNDAIASWFMDFSYLNAENTEERQQCINKNIELMKRIQTEPEFKTELIRIAVRDLSKVNMMKIMSPDITVASSEIADHAREMSIAAMIPEIAKLGDPMLREHLDFAGGVYSAYGSMVDYCIRRADPAFMLLDDYRLNYANRFFGNTDSRHQISFSEFEKYINDILNDKNIKQDRRLTEDEINTMLRDGREIDRYEQFKFALSDDEKQQIRAFMDKLRAKNVEHGAPENGAFKKLDADIADMNRVFVLTGRFHSDYEIMPGDFKSGEGKTFMDLVDNPDLFIPSAAPDGNRIIEYTGDNDIVNYNGKYERGADLPDNLPENFNPVEQTERTEQVSEPEINNSFEGIVDEQTSALSDSDKRPEEQEDLKEENGVEIEQEAKSVNQQQVIEEQVEQVQSPIEQPIVQGENESEISNNQSVIDEKEIYENIGEDVGEDDIVDDQQNYVNINFARGEKRYNIADNLIKLNDRLNATGITRRDSPEFTEFKKMLNDVTSEAEHGSDYDAEYWNQRLGELRDAAYNYCFAKLEQSHNSRRSERFAVAALVNDYCIDTAGNVGSHYFDYIPDEQTVYKDMLARKLAKAEGPVQNGVVFNNRVKEIIDSSHFRAMVGEMSEKKLLDLLGKDGKKALKEFNKFVKKHPELNAQTETVQDNVPVNNAEVNTDSIQTDAEKSKVEEVKSEALNNEKVNESQEEIIASKNDSAPIIDIEEPEKAHLENDVLMSGTEAVKDNFISGINNDNLKGIMLDNLLPHDGDRKVNINKPDHYSMTLYSLYNRTDRMLRDLKGNAPEELNAFRTWLNEEREELIVNYDGEDKFTVLSGMLNVVLMGMLEHQDGKTTNISAIKNVANMRNVVRSALGEVISGDEQETLREVVAFKTAAGLLGIEKKDEKLLNNNDVFLNKVQEVMDSSAFANLKVKGSEAMNNIKSMLGMSKEQLAEGYKSNLKLSKGQSMEKTVNNHPERVENNKQTEVVLGRNG